MTRERGRRAARLPRHLRRHRLAHHDGQRPRRARLGRRRHRGRGRHARPAGVDADPAGGRLQAHRRDPGRRHRHRRRPDDHREAAQARRGRQVRRVLRRGRRRRAAGQPGHDRQHEPRVRLDLRDLPDRRRDPGLPAAHRPRRRSRSPWSRRTPRSRGCGTTRPASRASREYLELDLSTVVPSIAGPKRPQDRVRAVGGQGVVPRRRCATTSSTTRRRQNGVDEASAESFPASDAPAVDAGAGTAAPGAARHAPP